MKLDRTKLEVEELHGGSESSDLGFWHAMTPIERLRAVQVNRLVAYGRASTSQRLQRVLEVAERS